ncbi:hypothetical protein QTI17_33765 [Variovorax sp. J31P179]|uniref:hypothetical protein n=1 Tax=Variovorax sp. J31P179 TaxID=3053508 RepID=UPI0025791525|nr:hypothetical protein [Variovorax sp. J31P179]MDM0085566.1 hypothetical protein [Variovorax sp. J31P179]
MLNDASDTIAAMSQLRNISVFVDEPVPGHFHWVLHEGSPSSVWIDIADSEQSYTSWTEAFEAGIVELYRIVQDKRFGPRAPGEDENVDPIGS